MTSALISILLMSFFMVDTTPLTTSTTPTHGGEIDLTASTLRWTGKKVAGSHTGLIKLKAGHLIMDQNQQLSGGSFEIDMTTITTTDLSGKKAQSLVGHLLSADFFEVDKFPSALLEITKVTPSKEQGYYLMEADLTIKGIVKPVAFTTQMVEGTVKSTIKVDRTKYDIKYGSGSFFDNLGDRAIDNDFNIVVTLVLK